MHKALAMLCAAAMLLSSLSAQQQPRPQADYVFRANAELVLVNVTVRDKSGKFVRNLKPQDFTLLEDGKAQKIATFDVENTDALPPAEVPQAITSTTAPAAAPATPSTTAQNTDQLYRDRRLIVLFFDVADMEPDEIERSTTAAENYVDKQMLPADLVSVVRSTARFRSCRTSPPITPRSRRSWTD